MTRVEVSPRLIRWARERAGLEVLDLAGRFPRLAEWEEGEEKPTLRQLEHFARAVHVPFGYLLLPEPPTERLPIPDFRTVAGRGLRRPGPDLLDTIYACQERQAWFREFAQVTRQPPLPFVGSASLDTAPVEVAERMRATLGIDLDRRRDCRTWAEALRLFVQQADRAGILVMVSGIVGSNTHRKLDPGEFRGFALADPLAPLVFVNGADSKAAQMFTLAHEIAHLWLGSSAVSDLGAVPPAGHRREEVWCNAVAAEVLVPIDILRAELVRGEPLDESLRRLARRFKVSTLVVLRRLLDAGRLNRRAFNEVWQAEIDCLRDIAGAGGGDFYRSTVSRVSRRFVRAVVESTLEGQTLYRDAFRMLGVARNETFNNLGRAVGLPL
jgi:Zn-dependent peptidase ImmA (M78 family)